MLVKLLAAAMIGISLPVSAMDSQKQIAVLSESDFNSYKAAFDLALSDGDYESVIDGVNGILANQTITQQQNDILLSYWARAEEIQKKSTESTSKIDINTLKITFDIALEKGHYDSVISQVQEMLGKPGFEPYQEELLAYWNKAETEKQQKNQPSSSNQSKPQRPMTVYQYRGQTAQHNNANDYWNPNSQAQPSNISPELQQRFNRLENKQQNSENK